MEQKCSMADCENSLSNYPRYRYYPFPKDFNLCMQWVQTCGKPELFEDFAYGGAQPFLHKTICSTHFRNCDFTDPEDPFQGLKLDAIPIQNFVETTAVKNEIDDEANFNQNGIDDDTNSLVAVDHMFIKEEPQDMERLRENSLEQLNQISHNDINNVEQHNDSIRLSNEINQLPLLLSRQNLFWPDKLFTYSQNAFRTAWKRALETAEQREARNRANALRNAFRRANETDDQKRARNHANAIRTANRRANETELERKDRLYKNAVRAALRRSMESDEQQQDRRQKNALRAAFRRSVETPEQRAQRLLKDKLRSAKRRKHENETQAKIRRYNDAVRAAFRRSNENDKQRQQRKLYDVLRAAKRRSNETDEQREARLRADRERAAKRRMLKKVSHNISSISNEFLSNDINLLLNRDPKFAESLNSLGDSSNYSFDCTDESMASTDSVGNLTNDEMDSFTNGEDGSNVAISGDKREINVSSSFKAVNDLDRSNPVSQTSNVQHTEPVPPEVIWCT